VDFVTHSFFFVVSVPWNVAVRVICMRQSTLVRIFARVSVYFVCVSMRGGTGERSCEDQKGTVRAKNVSTRASSRVKEKVPFAGGSNSN